MREKELVLDRIPAEDEALSVRDGFEAATVRRNAKACLLLALAHPTEYRARRCSTRF